MIDELKEAVRASHLSRYRIAKDSDGKLSESELCRWLQNQHNLGQSKLDAVAAAVGVKLIAQQSTQLNT